MFDVYTYDIEEVKQLKKQLQKDIWKLVAEFKKKTGLKPQCLIYKHSTGVEIDVSI